MFKEILFESVKETSKISAIIIFLMIVIEFIEIRYNEKIKNLITRQKHSQIFLSAIFGTFPGCVGTFIIDSFYMSGLIGFGAINAVMIATSGDEAFVILSMAFNPDSGLNLSTVILLFATLFFLGIIGGYLANIYKRMFKLKLCKSCIIQHQKENRFEKLEPGHFFKEHVLNHILKKHAIKLILWLFFSIFIIKLLNESFNLEQLITSNKAVILLLAALIGVLPVSGPNLLFLTLFSQGMIPFSILLTNSIVQDGHGSLPLLSFSVADTLKIKLFNVIFGLAIGSILLLLGF